MPGFGGKKAAPFKRGGGRKPSHPNTAKGTPRRSKAAKGSSSVNLQTAVAKPPKAKRKPSRRKHGRRTTAKR